MLAKQGKSNYPQIYVGCIVLPGFANPCPSHNEFDTIRHLNNRPFNDWACFYIYRLVCYSDPTVYLESTKRLFI